MKRSHNLMAFAIMMIPMLAVGAFWKASQPVVTTSNVQASATEITLDYTLTDTDPASIMTTGGYSPEAVLVDSSGLVLASEILQIDTPSSLSLSGFSLTYGEEYTIQFDVPYDLLGLGSPYNEEPYTIYEETITINKQEPIAIIYGVNDTPASIVTGNEIEVHYDLVDDDEALITNETIAPRMIIWNNATDEVVDLASVEIGQDQVVSFSDLESSITYRVEITGQYDVDGDGLADNSAPYLLAEQLFTLSDYPQEWDQVYGGSWSDLFNSVTQTSDGGYLAVGYTRSNANGELTDTNNGYPACLDVGGVDPCTDALIVKFDSKGNPLWDQVYGGSVEDEFASVIESSDGGYLAVGYTYSNDGELTDNNNGYPECLDSQGSTMNAACQDALIVKFDSEGNPVWDKLYGRSGGDRFFSVIATTDGGYLAVGFLDKDTWLVKVDSVGDIQWEQTYGLGVFLSVIETRDGGYVAAGDGKNDNYIDEYNGGYDGLLVKFDENGNPLWDQVFGGSDYDSFHSVAETSTGEYIVAGYTTSRDGEIDEDYAGRTAGLVAKFDTVGNPIWHKVYGESEWTQFNSVIVISDGSYLAAGYINHNADDENEQITDSYNGYYDGLLIKFDSEGNSIWDELYGGSDIDQFFSVIETSEGDYVAAGKTSGDANGEITDSNNGDSDALLVKFPAR